MTDQDAAPTHDLAVERAILGAMLEHPAEILAITEIITGEDFYRPLHGAIFAATVGGHNDGITGAVLINRRMLDSGQLANPADRTYLAELVGQAIPPGMSSRYAAELAELASRRRLAVSVARMNEALRVGAGAERIDQLADDIARAAQPRVTADRMIRLGELIDGGLTDIEHRRSRDSGVQTGIHDLDRLLGGGLRGGEMVIFAGRPGSGKSTLAMDVARHAAIRNKLAIGFFSLEMQTGQLFDRVLSAEASIPHHLIRTGTLTDADWARAGTASHTMAESPMFIHCGPLPMRQITNHCRRLKARGDLDLAVVDYLQIVPSERKNPTREQEVSEIARQIKLLAVELDCPIIAAAQLNRNPENRTDKRPLLGDLRESGELEQASDIVILLTRFEPGHERSGEADLDVAKNRSGALGTIPVAAQMHFSRFANLAKD